MNVIINKSFLLIFFSLFFHTIFSFERSILPPNVYKINAQIEYQHTSEFYDDNGIRRVSFLDKTLNDFRLDKTQFSGDISETTTKATFQFQIGLPKDINLLFSIPFYDKRIQSNIQTQENDALTQYYLLYYKNARYQGIPQYHFELSQGFGVLFEHQIIYAINYTFTQERFTTAPEKPQLTDGADSYGFYFAYKFIPVLSDDQFIIEIENKYILGTDAIDHENKETSIVGVTDNTSKIKYILSFYDIKQSLQLVRAEQQARRLNDSIRLKEKTTGLFLHYQFYMDNLLDFAQRGTQPYSADIELVYPISGENISNSIKLITSFSTYF